MVKVEEMSDTYVYIYIYMYIYMYINISCGLSFLFLLSDFMTYLDLRTLQKLSNPTPWLPPPFRAPGCDAFQWDFQCNMLKALTCHSTITPPPLHSHHYNIAIYYNIAAGPLRHISNVVIITIRINMNKV